MEASGQDPIPDMGKLQIQSDHSSPTGQNNEEEKQSKGLDWMLNLNDSDDDEFCSYEAGFEDPKIERLIEGAIEAITKMLENFANILEKVKKGYRGVFNCLAAISGYEGDEDDFHELLTHFADLLEEAKESDYKLSKLVECLIAEDSASNHRLRFFFDRLKDVKNEKGVSELLAALEEYVSGTAALLGCY